MCKMFLQERDDKVVVAGMIVEVTRDSITLEGDVELASGRSTRRVHLPFPKGVEKYGLRIGQSVIASAISTPEISLLLTGVETDTKLYNTVEGCRVRRCDEYHFQKGSREPECYCFGGTVKSVIPVGNGMTAATILTAEKSGEEKILIYPARKRLSPGEYVAEVTEKPERGLNTGKLYYRVKM